MDEEQDPLTIDEQPSPTGEIINQSELQQAPDTAPLPDSAKPDPSAYARGSAQQDTGAAVELANDPAAYTPQQVEEPKILHRRYSDPEMEDRKLQADQREAERQQREAQKIENDRARTAQKILKDQGVEMELDPTTGTPRPRRDAEGNVLFKPETTVPFEQDQDGKVYTRKRDRYGNEQRVPLVPKTDPETGEKYVVGEDGVTRHSLGPDEDFLTRKRATISGQESALAKKELDTIRGREKELKKRVESADMEAALLRTNKNLTPEQQARLAQLQKDKNKATGELSGISEQIAGLQSRYDAADAAHTEAKKSLLERQKAKFGGPSIAPQEAPGVTDPATETYKAENPARMTREQLAAIVQQAAAATGTPDEKRATIEKLGLSPEAIRQKAQAGEISVEQARDLQSTIYGIDHAAPWRPDEAGFKAWLASKGKASDYQKASAGTVQDRSAMEGLRSQFVNELAAKNSVRPDFDWTTFNKDREKFVGAETGWLSKGASVLDTAVKSTLVATAGIATQALSMGLRATANMTGIPALIKTATGKDILDTRATMTDEERDLVARQTVKWWMGTTANAKRFWDLPVLSKVLGTDEAKAMRADTDALQKGVLEGTLTTEQLNGIADRLAQNAATVHGYNADPDQFNAVKNPTLAGLLMAYKQTGDPEVWDMFRKTLATDSINRAVNDDVVGFVTRQGKVDPNSWASAFLGGRVAGAHESVSEIAIDALTFGGAKVLDATRRGMSAAALRGTIGAEQAAGMLASLTARAESAGGAFAKLGLIQRQAGKELTAMERAWNHVVTATKAMGVSGAGEGMEEVVAGLGEPAADFKSLASDFVGGLIGAPIMTLVQLPVASALNYQEQSRLNKMQATVDRAYIEQWNESNKGQPGFVPLESGDVDLARTVSQGAFNDQMLRDWSTSGQTLMQLVSAADAGDKAAQDALPEAMQKHDELAATISERGAAVLAAVAEAKAAPGPQRLLYVAMIKSSQGAPMSPAEESALLNTKDATGNAYGKVSADGRTVTLSDAAIADMKTSGKAPRVMALVEISKPVRPAQATKTNAKPATNPAKTVPANDGQQRVPPESQGQEEVPTGQSDAEVEKAAQDLGLTYEGESEGVHAFTDPETGETFSIPSEELSPAVMKLRRDNGRKARGDKTESPKPETPPTTSETPPPAPVPTESKTPEDGRTEDGDETLPEDTKPGGKILGPSLLTPTGERKDGKIGQTHAQLKIEAAQAGEDFTEAEHGFHDESGAFLTRAEAWKRAEQTGQLNDAGKRKKGGKEELESQDLQEAVTKPSDKPVTEEKRSSTQVNLPDWAAKMVVDFGKTIDPADLYTEDAGDSYGPKYGLEDEPHITALYGLEAQAPGAVAAAVKDFGPVSATLGDATLFEGEKYDVLKFDVKSPDLHRLNAKLKELPFKSDFPDYKPHVTVAYLKKGTGKKYTGRNPKISGQNITFNTLVFSNAERKKAPISLVTKPATAETESRARRLVSEAVKQRRASAVLGALEVTIEETTNPRIFRAAFSAENRAEPSYRLKINYDRLDEKTKGMSDADAAAYVDAAMSEEITHFAQFEAVKKAWMDRQRRSIKGNQPQTFADAFAEEYMGVRDAMTDEQVEASRESYGDKNLGGPELGAEFIRQLIQNGAGETVTEATIRAKPIIERLLAVLKDLLDKIADAPAALKRAYDQTKAVLDEIDAMHKRDKADAGLTPGAKAWEKANKWLNAQSKAGLPIGKYVNALDNIRKKHLDPSIDNDLSGLLRQAGVEDVPLSFEGQAYDDFWDDFANAMNAKKAPVADKSKPKETSPLQETWAAIKKGLPSDVVLAIRLGDFHEFFNEDAELVSKTLNIALTNRNGVPMAGIPAIGAGAEEQIRALIKAGIKVAMADGATLPAVDQIRQTVESAKPPKKSSAEIPRKPAAEKPPAPPKQDQKSKDVDDAMPDGLFASEPVPALQRIKLKHELVTLNRRRAQVERQLEEFEVAITPEEAEAMGSPELSGQVPFVPTPLRGERDEINTRIAEIERTLNLTSAQVGLASSEPINFKTPLPRDKAAVFQQAAFKLLDLGVSNPKALAEALERKYEGRARPFSNALWKVLESVGAEEQAADWNAIYSEIDRAGETPAMTIQEIAEALGAAVDAWDSDTMAVILDDNARYSAIIPAEEPGMFQLEMADSEELTRPVTAQEAIQLARDYEESDTETGADDENTDQTTDTTGGGGTIPPVVPQGSGGSAGKPAGVGERDTETDAGPLGGARPGNVPPTQEDGGGGKTGADSGGSSGATDQGGTPGGPQPNGLPGGSGAGVVHDGGARADGTRGNYHLTDPEKIQGGSPKQRFARNRKAIETYQAVSAENREPTKEELDAIAAYIGWGSFGQELFQGNWNNDRSKPDWREESKWLRENISQAEWESIQRSITNAHYTAPPIVSVMWDMLRKMGFDGGRVLEPSIGIGNFYGLMPRDLMARSQLTGIELDQLTAGMAALLYPEANIQNKGYQDSKTADNFYDLVIGNWPFARAGELGFADRRYQKLDPSLHDYFFLKALDQVRPGGIVMGITSNSTMDRKGTGTRLEMSRKADLIGAFRFPSGTFKNYAGTSVVTDVLIFRKREADDTGKEPNWLNTKEIDTPNGKITVNEYFANNQGNVLGELDFGHGTTIGREGMIVNMPKDFEQRLEAIKERVPVDGYQQRKTPDTVRYISNNTGDRQGAVVHFEDPARREGRHPVSDLAYKGGRLVDYPSKAEAEDEMYSMRSKEGADQFDWSISTRDLRSGKKLYDVVYKPRQTANTAPGFYIVRGDQLAGLEDVVKYRLKNEKENERREKQLAALVAIRRTLGRLIDAQRQGLDTQETIRKELREKYQAFTKAHGIINESDGLAIIRKAGDPYYPSIAALERNVGTEEEKKFQPSTILERSTMRAKPRPDNPSIEDAYVMHRNESIFIDPKKIAEAARTTEQDVIDTLTKSGAIFKTPVGTFEPREIYLSGNVRRKLREAEDAKNDGQEMDANIEALKSVVPTDTPYFNIEAKFGNTWTTADDYKDFLAHLLNTGESREGIEVVYGPGGWVVRLSDKLKHSTEGSATWGVPYRGIGFNRLVTAAMNNQTLTVWKRDDEGNKYVDTDETKITNQKIEKLREEYVNWVWKEPTRRVRLERSYNEIFNAIAKPDFDGSFLHFDGMALERGNSQFGLRQHQANAIWRGVVTGRGIYAHEVGTGKTYTIGGVAVESRRYGKAKKPLIFAHNANSATVAREIQEMYPGAKVLYIENLDPDSRALTMAQIAMDDWDAIVVSHSLVDRFTLKAETLEELAKEEIADLEAAALDAAEEDGVELDIRMMDDPEQMKKVRSATAKELVKQRQRIKQKIAEAALKANEGAVFFEDLGVDMLIVDEAHIFKKPPIASKMQLRGLNKNGSGRSINMFFLTQYINRLNGGAGVHLFTGTPITNTLNEIFNMQRYMMGDVLKRDGVDKWDAWFNTFADSVTDAELSPAGDYEAVTRLAAFVNVAEMRRMIGEFMDVVFSDDMPEMQPRRTDSGKSIKGGVVHVNGEPSPTTELTAEEKDALLNNRTPGAQDRPYKRVITEVAEMSPDQKRIRLLLAERARTFRNANKRTRRQIMLSGRPESPVIVETDAANAGLDARMFDLSLPDHPESKVNRAVKNVLRHYNTEDRASQVIFMERGFSDMRTKSQGRDIAGNKLPPLKIKGLNLAADIVQKLVDSGIPQSEIAIVDGTVSKQERKRIADEMNSGTIRVVIGSTETLGTGVNMQKNLRAMHHLDAPWRPGDLEQRNGRGFRQGNEWNTVLEYRYITEGIDGRRWQVLKIKDQFIKSFLKADENTRVIEGDSVSMDEGESISDIAETFGKAAGDPRLIIQAKLRKDVEKLNDRERTHVQGVAEMQDQMVALKRRIEYNNGLAETLRKDADKYTEEAAKPFEITLGGKSYTDRKEADAALEKLAEDFSRTTKRQLGRYRGFSIAGEITMGGDPRIEIGGSKAYDAKPTIASLDANLRNIRVEMEKAIQRRDADKASMAALQENIKKPFGRAEELVRKKAMLDALTEDIHKYPVPAPGWLREGAPTDTEVYIDGQKRTVKGHRWSRTNWFVMVDGGETGVEVVPYDKIQDENGIQIFEHRPFEQPISQAANQARTPNGFGVGDFFRAVMWGSRYEFRVTDVITPKDSEVGDLSKWKIEAERVRDGRVEVFRANDNLEKITADQLEAPPTTAETEPEPTTQAPVKPVTAFSIGELVRDKYGELWRIETATPPDNDESDPETNAYYNDPANWFYGVVSTGVGAKTNDSFTGDQLTKAESKWNPNRKKPRPEGEFDFLPPDKAPMLARLNAAMTGIENRIAELRQEYRPDRDLVDSLEARKKDVQARIDKIEKIRLSQARSGEVPPAGMVITKDGGLAASEPSPQGAPNTGLLDWSDTRTVRDALEKIAQNATLWAPLAEQLVNFGDPFGLSAKVIIQKGRAKYRTIEHAIQIEPNESRRTVLHESIHALTVRNLEKEIGRRTKDKHGSAYVEMLREAQNAPETSAAVKELIGVYFDAIEKMGYASTLLPTSKIELGTEKHRYGAELVTRYATKEEVSNGESFVQDGEHIMIQSFRFNADDAKDAASLRRFLDKNRIEHSYIDSGRSYSKTIIVDASNTKQLRRSADSFEDRRGNEKAFYPFMLEFTAQTRTGGRRAKIGNADVAVDNYAPYGLGNLYEFVAEAFSNRGFQTKLAQIKGSGKESLWTRLIEAIADMLGVNFKVAGSLLEDVIRLSGEIIERPTPLESKGRDMNAPEGLGAAEPDTSPALPSASEVLLSTYRELPTKVKIVVAGRARGDSDEKIAAEAGITIAAVSGIFNKASAQLRRAREMAGNLPAVFKQALDEVEGQRTIGRPKLANPPSGPLSRVFVDVVDETRKQAGVPMRKADEEVYEQARALLDTPTKYNKQRRELLKAAKEGRGLNDVETIAAKMIVSKEALKAIKKGDQEAMFEGAMIVDAYRITGTEQARGFRQRRDWTKSPAERLQEFVAQAIVTPPKRVRERLEDLRGETDPKANAEREKMLRDWVRQMNRLKKQLKHLGLDLENMTDAEISSWLADRTRATRAVHAVQAAKADAWDMLYEYWIASILSAPPTQIANFIGNTGNSVWDFTAQRMGEAMVNLFVRDPNSAQLGEFAPMLRAIMPGLERASRNFLLAWRTETPVFEEEVLGEEGTSKIEEGKSVAIPGAAGRVIRMPLRMLLAVDEWSKSLIGQMQAAAEAYRIAKEEGLAGAALHSRIDALMEPGSVAWQNAVDKAKQLAFQEEMGKLGKAVMLAKSHTPVLRYFLPFVTTIANIFRTAIRKSPLGSVALLYRMSRQGAVSLNWDGSGYRYTRKDFVVHAAEQILAWSVFFAIRGLVEPGDDDLPTITGTVPYEFSKRGMRDLAYRTAPPMSIRLGGEWYSYSRIEPFATAISVMVDGLNKIRDSKNGQDHTQALADLMRHLTAQVKEKTFARGIADLLNAVEDGTNLVEWAANFATSWVPNLIRAGARESDDVVREQKIWGRGDEWRERLVDRATYKALPVAANAPEPKVDIWGREIEKYKHMPGTDWLWRMGFPSRTQAGGNMVDADRLILNWNNANPNDRYAPQPPAPSWDKTVKQSDGTKKDVTIYMTDREAHDFYEIAGRAALDLVNGQKLNADSPTRADIEKIKDSLSKARSKAREILWQDRLKRTFGDPYSTPERDTLSPEK